MRQYIIKIFYIYCHNEKGCYSYIFISFELITKSFFSLPLIKNKKVENRSKNRNYLNNYSLSLFSNQ